MRLSQILIVLLLVGGFTTGIAGFYGGLATQYGKTSTNFSTMSQSEAIASDINASMQIMKAAEQNRTIVSQIVAVVSAPLNLLFGAYNAGMIIMRTPAYFSSILSDIIVAIPGTGGVGGWVWIMVYGILSVIVLAAIIQFITGRET